MFTAERKRFVAVPAERVRAVLGDIRYLPRLIPHTDHVEVQAQCEERARVALTLRIKGLGSQRVEGEARIVPDGVRFVAVRPMEIDARWIVVPRDNGAEVRARLTTEVPKPLQSIARLIPRRLIEERVGTELEAALDALEAVLTEQTA